MLAAMLMNIFNNLLKPSTNLIDFEYVCVVHSETAHIFSETQQTWGFARFVSMTTALITTEGFIKDGNLTVGTHVCLRVANEVNCCATHMMYCESFNSCVWSWLSSKP